MSGSDHGIPDASGLQWHDGHGEPSPAFTRDAGVSGSGVDGGTGLPTSHPSGGEPSGWSAPPAEAAGGDDSAPALSHGDGQDAPGRADVPGTPSGDGGAGGSGVSARRVRRGEQRRGRGSFLRELPILILVAFLLALLIKTVLVQAFWIPSESMERTLLINDRVLVNKVVYHFRDVHRGDVVVFNGEGTGFEREAVVNPPGNALARFVRGAQELLGLGAPNEKDFIKRVIGVGGDVVACCDAQGRVTVNGKALTEPYVYENDFQQFGPVTVPKGDLWLMGDHRSRSSDSRENGPVPVDKVIGRAFVRVWPLSRFGFLTVPSTFSDVPSAAGARPAVTGATAQGGPLAGLPSLPEPVDAMLLPVSLTALPALSVRRRSRRRRTRARAGCGAGGVS